HTNILCFCNLTSSVALSVSYTPTLHDALPIYGAITQNISGLAAGVFSVTVTDANGCSATASATVTQPAQLTASATPTNILCFGSSADYTSELESRGEIVCTLLLRNRTITQNIS